MSNLQAAIIAAGILAAGVLVAISVQASDATVEAPVITVEAQPTVIEVWMPRDLQALALANVGFAPTCQELHESVGFLFDFWLESGIPFLEHASGINAGVGWGSVECTVAPTS